MHQNWRIELLINWTTLPEAMQSICYNAVVRMDAKMHANYVRKLLDEHTCTLLLHVPITALAPTVHYCIYSVLLDFNITE